LRINGEKSLKIPTKIPPFKPQIPTKGSATRKTAGIQAGATLEPPWSHAFQDMYQIHPLSFDK